MLQVDSYDVWTWTYVQGLKHMDLSEVCDALMSCGKKFRDEAHLEHYLSNYWNGWHNSDLYHGKGINDLRDIRGIYSEKVTDFFNTKFTDYEEHPNWGLPEVENRFIPCDKDSHPLIKWGKEGCLRLVDAQSYKGCVYIGENLKGTFRLVIDCDGDHDETDLDFETIEFLSQWRDKTHCMSKPKLCREYGVEGVPYNLLNIPASFHLTFHTEQVIPTYHFNAVHIDILGNRKNQARFFKNKVWNGLEPAPMTEAIWEELQKYIERRADGIRGCGLLVQG